MSKSVGNVADPLQAIDELGLDAVRYYLARVGGRFKDDVGEYLHPAQDTFSKLTPLDWSSYQLNIHLRELSSLLGNTYLRITGKKLQARVDSVESVSAASLIDRLSESSEAAILLKTLRDDDQGLARIVDGHMQNLELADALDKIMDTLSKVRQPLVVSGCKVLPLLHR